MVMSASEVIGYYPRGQHVSTFIGSRALAPLTGTDARALGAAVQIIELYTYDRNSNVLAAFGLIVMRPGMGLENVRGIDSYCQLMESGCMAYSQTKHYDAIIQRQIRSGRATSKSEVIHQALELLDAVTRGGGPVGSAFEGPDDLATLLRAGLKSGPAVPMTEERWAKIRGR
jgi:Arc/MetJ-type ribon-helix-helix transcriptional regulator